MRILVTGAKGQLGTGVLKVLQERSVEHRGVDIDDFDISDQEAVNTNLEKYLPDTVIHCAAYTAVDAAEENAELCLRINKDGTENLARVCSKINAEMIYISTDYVFNGEGNTPYETNAPKGPLQIYGKSKLAGEEAVMQYLDKYYIVRTSWVFGENGTNFVKTMLKLAQTRTEINVVDDQIGSPTYTPDLASLLCDLVQSGKHGVFHATNEGFCSWAEFAEESLKIINSSCRIKRIPTEQFPTKALRPRNSRLSKTSLSKAGFSLLPEWNDALERYIGVV